MIRRRLDDGVTWITFDRPERLNAFTTDDYETLGAHLAAAAADTTTRAVVLTGTGRAFSAGADRSLFEGPLDPDASQRVDEAFRSMLLGLSVIEKPTVAAVNGLAVGVGATLLLHCDLVILAQSARLRMPFTELGLVPEAASSVLLPARVPWGDAVWTLLSSEWIDAEAATAMGLGWRVVPDHELTDAATTVATTLAALDPASVAATKRLLLRGRRELVGTALVREREAMQELLDARRHRR